jgi:hypothetical protein
MKTTFTALLLAGLMSLGAACTTDETGDNLGEAAQAATATTLATRCVNRIGAKRASLGLTTGNVNEWLTNGQGTYTQCASWAAWQDTTKGAHYTANSGFWCGSGSNPGGQTECLWSRNSSQTLEAQLDACVDAWWAEPNQPGNHHWIMQSNKYASCGIYSDGTKFSVQANFRNP